MDHGGRIGSQALGHSWYGPECECDPISASTSNFTACFSMLRDEFGRWSKSHAEATNGSRWEDRSVC